MGKSAYIEKRRAERLARQKRNRNIVIVIAVAIFAVVAFFLFRELLRLINTSTVVDTPFPLSDEAIRTRSGLVYDNLITGEGPEAKNGDTVSIKYTGYLPNGQVFDSNVETGEFYEFELGAGMVIAGWDEGIKGMRVGGARLLVIPPELTTGAIDPFMAIPANTTLTYSITLKEIK